MLGHLTSPCTVPYYHGNVLDDGRGQEDGGMTGSKCPGKRNAGPRKRFAQTRRDERGESETEAPMGAER